MGTPSNSGRQLLYCQQYTATASSSLGEQGWLDLQLSTDIVTGSRPTVLAALNLHNPHQ